MGNNSLTCKELVELVTEYFEGTLPEHDRERFEAHVAGCQGCTNYLQQMRQTIQLIGELTETTIAPDARDELLDVFRNWNAD